MTQLPAALKNAKYLEEKRDREGDASACMRSPQGFALAPVKQRCYMRRRRGEQYLPSAGPTMEVDLLPNL
jgi:hypothetical protein